MNTIFPEIVMVGSGSECFGSGSLIIANGSKMVVTAGHVVRRLKKNPYVIRDIKRTTRPEDQFNYVGIPITGIVMLDNDVAILGLPFNPPGSFTKCELENEYCVSLGDRVEIIGYGGKYLELNSNAETEGPLPAQVIEGVIVKRGEATLYPPEDVDKSIYPDGSVHVKDGFYISCNESCDPGMSGAIVCFKGQPIAVFVGAFPDLGNLYYVAPLVSIRFNDIYQVVAQIGELRTSLIKLGAINASGQWVERAGMNGISGSDDTPRFYSGGDLASAILRASGDIVNGAKCVITESGKIYGREVELFGSVATAPTGKRIKLNHETNSIELYDDNDDLKAIISSDPIPELSVLLASSTTGGQASASTSATASDGTPSVNNSANTVTLTLPATVDIYKVTTPAINYTLNASVGAQMGNAYAKVEASLVASGKFYFIGLNYCNLNPGQTAVSYSGQFLSKVINNVQPGSCYIQLKATAHLLPDTGSAASCSINVSGTMSAQGLSQKSKIFKDGAFYMQDSTHYAYIHPDLIEFNAGGRIQRLQATGNANVSRSGYGILRSANVSATGVVTNIIGQMSDAAANGNGEYTINHSIGHTNYTVQITPYDTAGNRNGMVITKSTNTCLVKLYNNGTAANMKFDITIFGY